MYMVLTLGIRHSLSWDAQVDVLKIFSVMYGDSSIPTTKYKYLQSLQHSTDDDFVNNILTYRFRTPSNPSQFSDIYDGSVYRKLFDDGLLSNPFNFSYCFFTDGIAFGDSSNKTLWPVYLTINELPYEDRAKYIILAGLYVGPRDPNLQTIMEPFVKEANQLSQTGLSWNHNGQNVVSLVIPLCGIADSVARFKLINLSSYNANHGCTFCYIRTERTKAGRRFVVGSSGPAALRTAESFACDLVHVYRRRHETKKEDRIYKGVKGVCPLLDLQYFNFSPCKFPVDYMHNILLGVVKFHTELLLDPRRKKCWILEDDQMGIDHISAAVDERILKIQSSSAIMRILRPLKSKSLWRANEFKTWILLYFYPCCDGLLKKKHMRHLSMLSRATFIFLQKTITIEELIEAENLCQTYIDYFQKYFGVECMRYNLHLLSHLSHCVKLFGPLWGLNSFVYEAQNRYIKKLAKNPNTVILEIGKKFLIHQSLPFLSSTLGAAESAVKFTTQILNYKLLKDFVRSKEGYGLLGKYFVCSLLQEEQKALLDHTGCTTNLLFYHRVIVNAFKYSTSSYCKGFKINDSFAKTIDGDFLEIRHLILSFESTLYVICEKLYVQRTELHHVKLAQRSGIVKCINASSLSQPCIAMEPVDNLYISTIPYGATVE
ncbi:hypothetical protein ONE63_011335 [Megalurothrips usitatus]|uniref:DUF4218 domain-containing protein n=1 Tax=Megalurothrips usitatus TaxID=439358 RepID=A0AAV7X2U7_9NEOP|nr:hypothetical protein ONE63_011335 [Megalurothrips usitatus]